MMFCYTINKQLNLSIVRITNRVNCSFICLFIDCCRRRCIPHEWVCDKDFDCSGDDESDEDETLCQFKEKCLPNQSECASAAGTGVICIDTEKFCDGHYDCINDEYTEYCGKIEKNKT